MNIKDLTKNEDILISDLEKGKMYLRELIIERDNKNYSNMVTARKEGENILTSRYHIISEMGKVKLILLDESQEYSPTDREYRKLNEMLKKAI